MTYRPFEAIELMAMNRLILGGIALVFLATVSYSQDLFLQGGRLVDPGSQTVVQKNLLILDGRIAGTPQAPPAGFEGTVLELEGKWVIPGLHDLHTHSYGNRGPGGKTEFLGTPGVARRMLYAGVTGFLDLFNAEDLILSLRNRQRGDGSSLPEADIFASGPCLTATDGHCTEYGIPTRIINNPEDAVREVGELAAKKPDVVKIVYSHAPGVMPSIDLATLEAAVKTATEHGIPTVIHVNSWQDMRESVLAGAKAVTHVPSPGPIPADLAELMAERGVYSIPTLAVHCDLPALVGASQVLGTPLLQAVTNQVILNDYGQFDPNEERSKGRLDRYRQRRPHRLQAVKELADAGVAVLTGTDAGNPGAVQGFSVHRELSLLVEAGLSPWQALASSTTLAGEFLGRPWGLDVGDEASLVVLDASPVDDIANTQKIHLVIHHGVAIDREGLLKR